MAANREPAHAKIAPVFTKDIATMEKGEESESQRVMNKFHSYETEFTARVEKQLRRKIDIRIMPLVVIIYIFNYLDRNSVSRYTRTSIGTGLTEERSHKHDSTVLTKTDIPRGRCGTRLSLYSQPVISPCNFRPQY